MANTIDLRQKRETIKLQMKDMVARAEAAADETRKAELFAEFDKAELEERNLAKLIAIKEQEENELRGALATEMENRAKAPGESGKITPEKEYEQAFRSWFTCKNQNHLPAEVRAILEKRGTNAQIAGTDSLGGYTVQDVLWPELIKTMKDYSGIFQAARVIQTAKGNTINFATNDDTSAAAVLVAESGAFTVQDTTFGTKTLDAYAYRDLMKASWELMQDSEFDMGALINENMGVRFGRALNAACTTGTGSSQPNGVVTASTAGKTAASATAIIRSELVDLVHSVDPAYRASGNCAFMFNDSTFSAIKKLALGSADASPLWQTSMRDGAPDTIEGYKYFINQGMASIATGNKTILFGDFSKYMIRIVKALQLVRLDELYAANGQVGFYGFMRFDGELLDTGAVKHLVQA